MADSVFSDAHCPAGPPSMWLRAKTTFRSSVSSDLAFASRYRCVAYSHSCALCLSDVSPLNLKGLPISLVSFEDMLIVLYAGFSSDWNSRFLMSFCLIVNFFLGGWVDPVG